MAKSGQVFKKLARIVVVFIGSLSLIQCIDSSNGNNRQDEFSVPADQISLDPESDQLTGQDQTSDQDSLEVSGEDEQQGEVPDDLESSEPSDQSGESDEIALPTRVSGAFLTGTVANDAGEALSGAEIYIRGAPETKVKSDLSGRFRIEVSKKALEFDPHNVAIVGRYKDDQNSLAVISPPIPYEQSETGLALMQVEGLIKISLKPTGSLQATVNLGEPDISGESGVYLKIPGTDFLIEVKDGKIDVTDLPPGDWDLIAEKEGHKSQKLDNLNVKIKSGEKEIIPEPIQVTKFVLADSHRTLTSDAISSLNSDGLENANSLSWVVDSTKASGVLIIMNNQDSFSLVPEDGKQYSPGEIISNTEKVLFFGLSQSLNHEGLVNDTAYYYLVYSYDAEGIFSKEPLKTSATPRFNPPPPAPVSVDDKERFGSISQTPVINVGLPTDTSDIDHFELALGTSVGATDLLDWTNVGNSASIQHSVSLPNGKMIFASVKSVDSYGKKSAAVNSDGYQNLECPNDSSETGVGVYIKVHGNTTIGLGGKHYSLGSKTSLDWSQANSGNAYTPGSSDREITDFCVAKYEAKLRHSDENNGNPDPFIRSIVAQPDGRINGGEFQFNSDYSNPSEKIKYRVVSSPHGRPWVRISAGIGTNNGGKQACEDLGNGFQIINNAQWQTIARDIESVDSNWNREAADPDEHYINTGHSDSNPFHTPDADTDGEPDDNPCVGTEQTACTDKTSSDYKQKRTHLLSSGETIWDFAGGVWELLADHNHRTNGHGNAGALATGMIHTDPFSGSNLSEKTEFKLQFGSGFDRTSLVGNLGGFGRFEDDDTPGGGSDPDVHGSIARGGDWDTNEYPGIYTTTLRFGRNASQFYVGFRCTFAP